MRIIEIESPETHEKIKLARFGNSNISAAVPISMIEETRALLYASTKQNRLWAIASEFNTQKMNPLFGVSQNDLRTIAEIEEAKAPWHLADLDVTAALIAIVNHDDPQGITPILITRLHSPMAHVALLARFSDPHSYFIDLKFTPDTLFVGCRSALKTNASKARPFLSFSVPMSDPVSLFLQKIIENRQHSPRFIFAIPNTVNLWSSLNTGTVLPLVTPPLAEAQWRGITVSGSTITRTMLNNSFMHIAAKRPDFEKSSYDGPQWERFGVAASADLELMMA